MKTPVKITYTNPGTQGPVYITTSLSSPPWDPLEMRVSDEKTEAGELIFYREFDEVEEGEYQYKFRLGPGDWWVLDHTTDTATDAAGNKNNVIVVRAKFQSGSEDSKQEPVSSGESGIIEGHDSSAPAVQDQYEERQELEPKLHKVPVPFTVVEKVPDIVPPQYGDIKAHSLHEDTSKRAKDAEPDPDAQYVSPSEAPPKQEEPSSPGVPSIPVLVVEKTDGEPSHGDDFGREATSSQKFAHEQRAADAEPNKVIISPERETPETDDAPLFAHETFGPEKEEEAPLLPHERSHEPSEESDEQESYPDEPRVIEGGIPLFIHEVVDNGNLSPILQRGIGKNSSNASLQSMSDHEDIDEDIHDPSIAPFPTNRDEIFEQVASISNRLPEDETVDTRNLSPIVSRSCSSAEPGSPLDTVAEEPDGAEEDMDLPSPAVDLAHSTKFPAGQSEGRESLRQEDEVDNSNGSGDAKKTAAVNAPEPTTPVSRGPLTPPLTPKEAMTSSRHAPLSTLSAEVATPTKADSVSVSEESAPKPASEAGKTAKAPEDASSQEVDNRATSPSSAITPTPQKQESFFQSFFRVVFGSWLTPLGRLFASLCGGKRNATAVVTVAVLAFVAYYLVPPPPRSSL